nr:MAG TPA: hypothetical protein [Caudoviricetes sp.]
MKQLEIYQKIALAVNDAAKSKNPRLTIAVEGELGCAYFLHINAVSAEVKPYAQYNEALTICFKKRGGRTVYGMRIYGEKPIAIFSGWPETTYEQPKSFWCFDKNLFYGLVDGFPQELKLAEESERVHLAEIQAKGKIYKVVSMNPDDTRPRMIVETFETVEHLKKAFETAGEFHSVSCRAELQGAPKLKNFCGPMYDGTDEAGNSVIRYESREVYEILSA